MEKSLKIVFATHNEHKYREVAALMPKGVELLNLTHIGCYEDIPETADTIEGNALLKAQFVLEHYQVACFADDTGLEVKALNGAPGVYSARYAGPAKNDYENINKLLNELKNVQDREARFKTVIAYCTPTSDEMFTGICEGFILEETIGEHGFGYDPVFQPKGYSLSFAEMELEEKSAISHRGKAIAQLVAHFQNR